MRYPHNRRAMRSGQARSLSGGALRRIFLLAGLVFGLAVLGSTIASSAKADTVGPITFEPTTYTLGNINGQDGWMKTGPYDVAVADVSLFPAASGYGFGSQALRLSDAITSGSFGDQTFSKALASPAGETASKSHFDANFSIGTTLATEQLGLHMSVSPDPGDGSRMSYLRFEDHIDGVHVFFDDVTNPGPVGTVSNFNETQIAILDRTTAHSIRFSIDFKLGAANDVVKIYVDGAPKITGTTWEDYYRFDPEAASHLQQVPQVSRLLFRESGTNPFSNLGNGFLVDGLSLSSTVSPPSSKDQCKNGGWQTFDNPTFKNQGECVAFATAH
jgi:hypothetical protein